MYTTYENESAKLLFEEIREDYAGFEEDIKITEDMALAMYYHARNDNIPVINELIHVPVYNFVVY